MEYVSNPIYPSSPKEKLGIGGFDPLYFRYPLHFITLPGQIRPPVFYYQCPFCKKRDWYSPETRNRHAIRCIRSPRAQRNKKLEYVIGLGMIPHPTLPGEFVFSQERWNAMKQKECSVLVQKTGEIPEEELELGWLMRHERLIKNPTVYWLMEDSLFDLEAPSVDSPIQSTCNTPEDTASENETETNASKHDGDGLHDASAGATYFPIEEMHDSATEFAETDIGNYWDAEDKESGSEYESDTSQDRGDEVYDQVASAGSPSLPNEEMQECATELEEAFNANDCEVEDKASESESEINASDDEGNELHRASAGATFFPYEDKQNGLFEDDLEMIDSGNDKENNSGMNLNDHSHVRSTSLSPIFVPVDSEIDAPNWPDQPEVDEEDLLFNFASEASHDEKETYKRRLIFPDSPTQAEDVTASDRMILQEAVDDISSDEYHSFSSESDQPATEEDTEIPNVSFIDRTEEPGSALLEIPAGVTQEEEINVGEFDLEQPEVVIDLESQLDAECSSDESMNTREESLSQSRRDSSGDEAEGIEEGSEVQSSEKSLSPVPNERVSSSSTSAVYVEVGPEEVVSLIPDATTKKSEDSTRISQEPGIQMVDPTPDSFQIQIEEMIAAISTDTTPDDEDDDVVFLMVVPGRRPKSQDSSDLNMGIKVEHYPDPMEPVDTMEQVNPVESVQPASVPASPPEVISVDEHVDEPGRGSRPRRFKREQNANGSATRPVPLEQNVQEILRAKSPTSSSVTYTTTYDVDRAKDIQIESEKFNIPSRSVPSSSTAKTKRPPSATQVKATGIKRSYSLRSEATSGNDISEIIKKRKMPRSLTEPKAQAKVSMDLDQEKQTANPKVRAKPAKSPNKSTRAKRQNSKNPVSPGISDKCNFCKATLEIPLEVQVSHTKFVPPCCSSCKPNFGHLFLMIQREFKQKIFKCSSCRMIHETRAKALSHLKRHDRSKTFVLRKSESYNVTGVKEVSNSSKESKPNTDTQFSCKLCPKKCTGRRGLTVHMLFHSREKESSVKQEPDSDEAEDSDSEGSVDDSTKRFQCKTCPKKFGLKKELNAHLQCHALLKVIKKKSR